MISERLRFPLTDSSPLFPPASDREAWAAAARNPRTTELRAGLLALAEAALREPIPEVTASDFMLYERTGNRSIYEKCYFDRRRKLEALVMAECLQNEGRYLDRIIDFLWAITSEHCWTVPAHCALQHDVLPYRKLEFIDLFAAETGMLLAQTLNFLEPQLRAVSENLVAMVRDQLIDRIVYPMEADPEALWWKTGYNNWTPWCASNVLGVALYVLKDQPKRQESLIRLLALFCDRFYEKYPADGACDEGPGYWVVAPGRLFWFLEQLYHATGGATSIYGEEKMRRMGEYIVDSNLAGDYYAAFSDAPPRMQLQPAETVLRYAERVGSERLRRFANSGDQAPPLLNHGSLLLVPARLFWLPVQAEPAVPASTSVAWYADSQQFYLKCGDLSFAAVAAHNDVSHNHNDVGQFILFYQGEPVIVDVGAGEYTKNTFNEHRYENWILNSFAHNVPIFDGVGQHEGREFAARDVQVEDSAEQATFSQDLAGAYPRELELEFCRRLIRIDKRSGEVKVSDQWKSRKPHSVSMTLFTPGSVVLSPSGLGAVIDTGSVKVELRSEHPLRVETMAVTDSRMKAVWPPVLKKIILTLPPHTTSSLLSFHEKRK